MTEEEFYSLKPGDKIAYSPYRIEGKVIKEPGIRKTFNRNGFLNEWGKQWTVMQITNDSDKGWSCEEGEKCYGLFDYQNINLITRAAKKNQRIPIKYIP